MRGDHEVATEDKAKGGAQGGIKAFFQQLPLGEATEPFQHSLGISTQACPVQLQGSLINIRGALLCMQLSSLALMGVHGPGCFSTR